MTEDAGLVGTMVGVLDKMGVPYMITGSVALSAWALPRMTHDIDIVLDLPEERVAEFCAYFPDDRYYIDEEAMIDSFRQRDQPSMGMYSFTDMDSALKIDLFPLRNDPVQRAAFDRRVRAEVVEGVEAEVCAPSDLLVQKLQWYAASDSERQFRDCLNLLMTDMKRVTSIIDTGYVEDWVERLGAEVQTSWARLKAAVRQASV